MSKNKQGNIEKMETEGKNKAEKGTEMIKKEIKNIEESKGGKMNILKKIVMGISGYFKETYSDHVFSKVVSILVVMCFILNIANLPAYAGKKKSRYEEKQKIERMKSEGSSPEVAGYLQHRRRERRGHGRPGGGPDQVLRGRLREGCRDPQGNVRLHL